MLAPYWVRANSLHDLPREGEAMDDLTREANDDRIRVMIFYGVAIVVPSFEIDMKDFLSEDHLYETISDAVIPHLDDPIPISCWPAIIDEIVRCGFSLASNATDIELRVRYGIEVCIDEEYYLHNSHDDDDYGLSDGSDDDYLDYDDDDDMGVRMTREDVMKGLEKVAGVVEGMCVMCLEEFEEGSSTMTRWLVRLPCSHVYHGECIVKWLEESRRCPLCRYELPP